MTRVISKIEDILLIISAVLLGILMFIGSFDVIGRYVFNHPIPNAAELQKLLLMTVVAFGWAYAQRTDGHIKVDIFSSRYPPKSKAIFNFIFSILTLVIFGLIAWRAAVIGMQYWEEQRLVSGLNFPVAIMFFILVFGALITCLEVILNTFKLFKDRSKSI